MPLNNVTAAWAPLNTAERTEAAAAAAAITGKFELNWFENVLEIERFKKKFGHVNVSLLSKEDASYLPLYRWTLFQHVRLICVGLVPQG